MNDACTCSGSRYDGDDGWDRDCPEHGVSAEETREGYPDEYFVGFNGSQFAGDGYRALAHRNVDGEWRLRGWDALALRIWAAHLQASNALEHAIRRWSDLLWPPMAIINLGWRRFITTWPNPIFDHSRWTLPDYAFARPHMTNDEFRQLLADTVEDDAVTLQLWRPGEDEEAVATRREALSQYWGDTTVEGRLRAEKERDERKTIGDLADAAQQHGSITHIGPDGKAWNLTYLGSVDLNTHAQTD